MGKSILFILFFIWIPLLGSPYNLDDKVVQIKDIPELGILLDEGWKFKAGDDPAWALPDYPDDSWETINPTHDVRDVKPLWDAGRGWLRIKLKLDSALALQSIVMQVQQSTATEFYLDGQLIHRAGHIGEDPADVKARRIFADELLNLPLKSGQVHTLAVRIAVQKNMLYATWANFFTTALTVQVFDAYQGSLFVKNSDNSKLEIFNAGFFFILFLLHFALFLSNRSKKPNLYFSIFLFLYFFSGVINSNWTDSVEVQYLRYFLILLSIYFGFVFYYLAIQKILEIKRTKYVFIFFGAIGLIVIGSQYFYQYGNLLVSIPFLFLTLEFLRICLIGVKNRKRGAKLLLGGSTASFVFYLLFILAAARIIPQGDYFFWGHIYYFLAFVVLPVTISIYLALEYSFLSKALSRKLREVKFLSEKNQRQAEEKRKLLESQNETLEQKVSERTAALNQSLENLKATQAQLIQSEKMASLGELTAGIAHEIQNPLNFVNNFSEVSSELIGEIEEERAKNQEARDETLVSEILVDIKDNLEKINHHGKRADAIVKGMLEHSRTGSGEKELTDINTLAGEYLNLAYQSFKSKNKEIEIELIADLDPTIPKIELVRADIGKVLLNILNNAFYAVTSKFEIRYSSRLGGQAFEIQELPKVTIKTKKLGDKPDSYRVEISIKDNGPGIPDTIKEKIFQPFFTTKPTGQGTGLGLSLSYDIVKTHGGEIRVESNEGEESGCKFVIELPNA